MSKELSSKTKYWVAFISTLLFGLACIALSVGILVEFGKVPQDFFIAGLLAAVGYAACMDAPKGA